MVDRLARCGQRSVTALVDISNYVMFEFGRPSHIFDLDKIHGGLDVRWGRPGEQLKLLNGNTVTVDEKVGVIADDAQVESLAGIMGGDATAVSDDTRNVYVEAAFWWPRGDAGPFAPLQLLHRCGPPLRARRRSQPDGRAHRAHHAADPGDLRRRSRARWTTRSLQLPRAQAGHAARGARRQGDRHAADRRRSALDAFARLGLPARSGRRRAHRHAAAVPLRPRDRGRPDRGSGAHHRLRATCRPRRRWRRSPPSCRRRSRRSRFAVRRLLAALGYQETINFSFVEAQLGARPRRQRRPDQAAQPDRQPDERDALVADRLAAAGAQVQPRPQGRARARVRAGPRVPARRTRWRPPTPPCAACASRCGWPAWPMATPDGLQWGRKAHGADFYDVKGDVEALLAPLQAEFAPADASGHASGPLRRASGSTAARSASSANCTRAGASSGSCRMRRVLFELDLDAVSQRARAGRSSRCRKLPAGRARHRGDRGRQRSRTTQLMARHPRGRHRRPAARRAAVRRLQAASRRPPAWRRTRKAWPCA